jgi:dTDP-4-amino-4,6-dideoxygalactose transaminase
MSKITETRGLPPLLPSNPRASYLAQKEEIDRAVQRVLQSGWYILGKEVSDFEAEFASYIGLDFCVAVGSGTDALQVAFRACDIGPGDEVVTVSHTAVATVCAIQLCGATPVLVDIHPVTFTMDLNRLEDTLRSQGHDKIKAIVPVHLYGLPIDMDSVIEIARRHDLYVIEDCAQAHGARWRERRVGSFGDFGAFSFYPTKNIGAFGDGGGLVTNDSALADKARMLRQYGWRERYISEINGLNTRLDELQAAILRVKLRNLDQANDRRRAIASAYDESLSDRDLIRPSEPAGARHVYHQYVIRSKKRDQLKSFLRQQLVETAILYPQPIHLQQGYRDSIVVGAGGLHETERACAEILSLPMYPELSDDQVSTVTRKVLEGEASMQATVRA